MTIQSPVEAIAEKRRFWEQQIQQWRDSGLTQTEFCRVHNLKAHQLTYWKKRFEPAQAPVSLVELKWEPTFQIPTCPNPSPLRLILNEQFRIEVDRGFDPATLQQLVVSLRQL